MMICEKLRAILTKVYVLTSSHFAGLTSYDP